MKTFKFVSRTFYIVILMFSVVFTAHSQKKQRPISVENGKIFNQKGEKLLYGGENETDHFKINNCELKDNQFHYGIGREKFPALIDPVFISVEEADEIFKGDDRFLYLNIGEESRAYSIKDLTRHEVVNDIVGGQEVMAAYCILADLGAIYDRRYGEKVFTFALSGYTYYDPEVWDGMDGFIMWDRETESLWWPLTGRAVSGNLKDTKMKIYDEKSWSQTTWKEVKKRDPNTKVLKPGQDFERPAAWEKFDIKGPINIDGKSVAPRWGKN